MWLVLLAFHLVGLVGFNLIVRRSVLKKTDQFTLATILQMGIAIPAVVILFVSPPHLSRYDLTSYLFLIGTVLATIALQVTNVKSLQYLEASVFSVIYNLRIIITTIFGIFFLGESFVALRFLGGLLILLAIFVVRQRGSQSVRTKGLVWGISAVFTISFLNVFEKELIKHVGFASYFPLESINSSLLMWTYLLSSNKSFDFRILKERQMIKMMVFRAISAYGFSGALAAGALVSVANYISGMNVIFMVLLGAVVLKERDYLRQKIIATIFAVAGLTVVLISSR